MYILCIFHAYSVHIRCIFQQYSLHIPTICYAYSKHTLCIFQIYCIHIPSTFYAYSNRVEAMVAKLWLPGQSASAKVARHITRASHSYSTHDVGYLRCGVGLVGAKHSISIKCPGASENLNSKLHPKMQMRIGCG